MRNRCRPQRRHWHSAFFQTVLIAAVAVAAVACSATTFPAASNASKPTVISGTAPPAQAQTTRQPPGQHGPAQRQRPPLRCYRLPPRAQSTRSRPVRHRSRTVSPRPRRRAQHPIGLSARAPKTADALCMTHCRIARAHRAPFFLM